jgi:prolyl oligopeptidase
MQPTLAISGSLRAQKNCLAILLLVSFQILAQPPATRRVPVTDDYFGMKVTDNYRWMENLKDSSVTKWFEAQDAYAENIFNKISGRDELLAEYNAFDSLQSDQIWVIRKDGDTYLYLKWTVKEEALMIRKKGENGKEEVLIDFKKMFPGKKFMPALFEYSPVSKYITFYVFEGDHEAATLCFYDLTKRKFFPEQIRYSFGGYPFKTKFSKDGKEYFYFTISLVNNKSSWINTKAMSHRIGTSPEKDKVLVSKEKYPNLFPIIDSSYWHEVSVDPTFNYLILHSEKSSFAYDFVAPYSELENDSINWVMLTKPGDKLSQPIIRNGVAYFLSKSVPNQQLVKCSLNDLRKISFETVVPEGNYKFDNLSATKDFLFLRYTNGVTNWFKQYSIITGKLEDAAINLQGIIQPERISETGNETRLTLTSWNRPYTPYLYNAVTKNLSQSSIKNWIDYKGLDDLIVKETEVPGYDGTMIPLSIIYHKNTKLDGNAICLLHAYGSYGSVQSPWFSTDKLIYGKRNVVFAVAHVRGGGEKGETWRLGGFKATKPNTWKDLISCAEWLIENKYTSSNHLIAEGASAGGIAVGRAITERPDLFAVGINRVGVTNSLRFEFSASGALNSTEFGTIKDSLESRYLYEMDAVYHVKDKVKYPAVLNTAGMADGRVPEWQPGKFAAALQYSSTSNKPVLLQVYFQGGHFGESGKSGNLNIANEMAFALWQAGHPDFQLKK